MTEEMKQTRQHRRRVVLPGFVFGEGFGQRKAAREGGFIIFIRSIFFYQLNSLILLFLLYLNIPHTNIFYQKNSYRYSFL